MIDGLFGSTVMGLRTWKEKTGDKLANVIQYLAEMHPEQLERIFEVLGQRVPRIERVLAETMPDGRLLLQINDAPFSHPVLARFASDGTLDLPRFGGRVSNGGVKAPGHRGCTAVQMG